VSKKHPEQTSLDPSTIGCKHHGQESRDLASHTYACSALNIIISLAESYAHRDPSSVVLRTTPSGRERPAHANCWSSRLRGNISSSSSYVRHTHDNKKRQVNTSPSSYASQFIQVATTTATNLHLNLNLNFSLNLNLIGGHGSGYVGREGGSSVSAWLSYA
jgi:hypothetical protein